MYQWLFKKNGFKVAKELIFYFNGKKNEDMFNNKLGYIHLIRLDCSTSWWKIR